MAERGSWRRPWDLIPAIRNRRALWEILVPATLEEKEVPIEYHHEWDEVVRGMSGGLTILKPARGQWVSPEGNLFVEPMIPVRVYCSNAQIEQIADLTAEHYDQEAIMFYRVSSKVRIKNYKVDRS